MPDNSILTIGNFDGVHIGHQRILTRAREVADKKGLSVVAMTFDPHPNIVLRPDKRVPQLMSLATRIKALRNAGADHVVVLKPTPKLLSLEPEVFLEQLAGEHHPRAIIEGENFRFGKNRSGDVALLKRIGHQFGFETYVIDPISVVLDDLRTPAVSSTLIRWLLGHGRVDEAGWCLGRPATLSAPVVIGEGRGRSIGFPTANLDMVSLDGQMIPAHGVYAGHVELANELSHVAAVSVGIKPSFGGSHLAIEAHLLDFDCDLSGQMISIGLLRWIRDQHQFPNIRTLQDQLARDIELTRRWQRMGLLNGRTAA